MSSRDGSAWWRRRLRRQFHAKPEALRPALAFDVNTDGLLEPPADLIARRVLELVRDADEVRSPFPRIEWSNAPDPTGSINVDRARAPISSH